MQQTERLSLRELARRLGRDPSGLGRLARKGMIPKGKDGTFDEAAVRRALAENVDPGRGKEAVDSLRSTSTARPRTKGAAFPAPGAYRSRTDLPDDFARGVLYGLHAAAWHVPRLVAENAQLAGLPERQVAEVYAMDRECAPLLVVDALEAIGLLPPDSDDAGLLNPPAFDGYCPVRAK